MPVSQQSILDPRQAIVAGNQRLAAALARQDAAGMAACYTRDGEVLPPGLDSIRGRPGIQAFWQGAMDLGVREVSLETVELESHDRGVFEIGHFTLRGADGSEIDHGKYVVAWREEDGEWRLHRDIWNTSVAPAA